MVSLKIWRDRNKSCNNEKFFIISQIEEENKDVLS